MAFFGPFLTNVAIFESHFLEEKKTIWLLIKFWDIGYFAIIFLLKLGYFSKGYFLI
jgi:hypothetical protein